MCGIIGYVGHQQAAPILLEGLSRMEYRGYDSAGVAVRSGEKGLQIYKSKGRLQVLFADRFTGFSPLDRKEVGLQFVFPQRKLQPPQVSAFMAFFIDWLEK